MPQYAKLGEGTTIHSKAQLEHFGALVDDTAKSAGGNQRIITRDGYVLPIHIRDGLPRLDMRPPTDAELAAHPHVWLTSERPWIPSMLDAEFEDVHSNDTQQVPAMGSFASDAIPDPARRLQPCNGEPSLPSGSSKPGGECHGSESRTIPICMSHLQCKYVDPWEPL